MLQVLEKFVALNTPPSESKSWQDPTVHLQGEARTIRRECWNRNGEYYN